MLLLRMDKAVHTSLPRPDPIHLLEREPLQYVYQYPECGPETAGHCRVKRGAGVLAGVLQAGECAGKRTGEEEGAAKCPAAADVFNCRVVAMSESIRKK